MKKINFLIVFLAMLLLSYSAAPAATVKAEDGGISTNSTSISAAKTSKEDPYVDVTKKSVDKDAYAAITCLKAHKAFSNVVSGKKFYPNKKVTRREFLLILKNLFGSGKVPVSYNDLKKMNKQITPKYACEKMVAVAKRLKVGMKWPASDKYTLTRAGLAVYLKIFIDFDKRLTPKK